MSPSNIEPIEDGFEYLASPYTHPDPVVRQQRFEAVAWEVVVMMREGINVFAPIIQTHHIAVMHGLPVEWAFWENYDEAFVKRCSKLTILKLPGWYVSTGIGGEVGICLRDKIPVGYREPTPMPQIAFAGQ